MKTFKDKLEEIMIKAVYDDKLPIPKTIYQILSLISKTLPKEEFIESENGKQGKFKPRDTKEFINTQMFWRFGYNQALLNVKKELGIE